MNLLEIPGIKLLTVIMLILMTAMIGAAQIWIRPIQKHNHQLQKALISSQTQWQLRQKQQRESLYYATQIKQLTEKNETIIHQLNPTPPTVQLEKISQLAEQHRLQTQEITSSTTTHPSIKMQMKGGFIDFLVFLSALQASPGLCLSSYLQMNEKNEIHLQLECYSETH